MQIMNNKHNKINRISRTESIAKGPLNISNGIYKNFVYRFYSSFNHINNRGIPSFTIKELSLSSKKTAFSSALFGSININKYLLLKNYIQNAYHLKL